MKLPEDVEQQLRGLSEADWDALQARLRSPDASETLREAAGQHITGDRLDAFVALAHVSKYVDDAGQVNQEKLAADLRTLFDLPPAPRQQRNQNFGQFSPPAPMPGPGDQGNAEARKRFHGGQAPAGSGGGLAEAAKRFGSKEK